MIDKNILMAQFWANANQIVTADGIEIDLHNDTLLILSTTLRNVGDYPYQVQIRAEFDLDAFIAEMEIQLVEDLHEIDLNTLFAWLMSGKAEYSVFKP